MESDQIAQNQRDGIRCVSPIQAYLDLKGQPDRVEEERAKLGRVRLALSSADEKCAEL